ncbi:MAG: hypothetical protein OES13_00430 [Acidimicrobiia bacterium]|nr:hypothetical protein [Acidimicrobiia bacterium]
MARIPVAVIDRDPVPRENSFERSMTGADARIAGDKSVVQWLGRVFAEMENESRDWKIFDRKGLREFLRGANVDLQKAVDTHADSFPIPEQVGRLAECIDCFRGASFLTTPADTACLLINDRSKDRR